MSARRAQLRRWGSRAADAAASAFGVTVVAVAGSLLASRLARAGWLGVEYALFVCGVLALGAGTFAFRSAVARPESTASFADSAGRADRGIARRALGRFVDAPDRGRVPGGVGLFVAGCLILTLSFVVERTLVV